MSGFSEKPGRVYLRRLGFLNAAPYALEETDEESRLDSRGTRERL